jgi:hypothetical protein
MLRKFITQRDFLLLNAEGTINENIKLQIFTDQQTGLKMIMSHSPFNCIAPFRMPG